ncbi:RusA family crossover junction endodeoxyribonuclease [Xanthobacter sp. VTT E-85241]|uniref:RusA family crossover junction endodeoxyribonuclease n=1 Tax=Roseixanthobacter finlandensis TaxID=3119922 RepID=UPI003726DB71
MPSPRPRLGRGGTTFMPSSYTRWKADFIRCIPYQSKTQYAGAVSVFIHCDVSVPKSYTKKERQDALEGLAWPVGDVDNLAKSVLDAMTQAGCWRDDRQVVRLSVAKGYAELDSVQVRVVQG